MKIICVGRNYAAHAAEMGAEKPAEPVLFIKPDSALLREGKPFYHPPFSAEIHFECELVFRVGTPGKYIEEAFALRHIDGIGLGLDLTARDLQRTAKQQGLPWEIAKGFNDSAPVSEIFPLDEFGPLDDISFSLHHNGAQVQAGHTSMMLFQLPEIVAYASRFFTLKTGDLIFTGTPEGVGRLSVGDTLTGAIDGRELLWCEVK